MRIIVQGEMMSDIKRLHVLFHNYLENNVFLILQSDKIIFRRENIEEEETGWSLI